MMIELKKKEASGILRAVLDRKYLKKERFYLIKGGNYYGFNF